MLDTDIKISEGYQAFSAEILRLALLGITGYGFILSGIMKDGSARASKLELTLTTNHTVAVLGVISFGLAAIAALAHRYFSTDCITHMVRRCRLKRRLSSLKQEVAAAAAASGTDATFNEQVDARVEGKGLHLNWNKLGFEQKEGQLILYIKEERKSLYSDLQWCRWTLAASVLALIAGAGLVASLCSLPH